MIPKKVKAVLFDMDGTLIESVDLIAECWSKAFKKFGFNVSKEDIYKVVGLPADSILEKYIGVKDVLLFKKILEYARKCADKHMENQVLVDYRTYELLKYLKNKYKLGIVTSSSCKRTHELLEKYGLRGFFDTISCYTPGVRGKPEPDLLLIAMRSLKTAPSDTVYVGDSEVDYLAAKKLGMMFILVSKPWNKHLRKNVPSNHIIIVENLYDIAEYL